LEATLLHDFDKYADIVSSYLAENAKDPPFAFESKQLSKWMADSFGAPLLPAKNETLGVSLAKQKVAALFFDRIWSVPFIEDPAPLEIAARTASGHEFFPAIVASVQIWSNQSPEHFIEFWLNSGGPRFGYGIDSYAPARSLSEVFLSEHGIHAVPIYDDDDAMSMEYQPGNSGALVAAVQSVVIADNSSLTWPQILELRADAEAKVKLRRMRNWCDKVLMGQSQAQVEDSIATKLYDYEWAIRKHGLKTVSGAISQMLSDPLTMTTAAAATGALALGGAGIFSALGGGGLLVGKALVSLWEKKIDLEDIRRGPGAEIAFVHEIKKLSK
jgi:hypothetical protein